MFWPLKSKEEKNAELAEEFKEKVAEAKQVEASSEVCSACNRAGADKKYGGMWWHRKCLRKTRKMAKSMI